MTAGVQIRAAIEQDIPSVVEIYSWHVLNGTATFETDPPDRAEMSRRWESLTGSGFPYLVAALENRVIGYAYASFYRPRAAYCFTVEDSVYLRPEFTGQGLGSGLLQRLAAECGSAGLRQMIAVIGDSANIASIRLHRRCGFRDVGVLRDVGFKFNRWLDTVLMQREL